MKGHVAFIALAAAKISHRFLRPLVRLREQHAIAVLCVQMRAQFLQVRVRLGQTFTRSPLALVQIGHGIQAETIHPQVQPELKDAQDFPVHRRIVKIQVGLMGIKAMPEIGARDRVPGPV